jgi:ribosomal protein S18 acetylase RimI-like enzyme
MTEMELEIRVARPDDRGPIAELMYASGTDVYDFLFRGRAREFLRHEFASGRGFAGHPHVTVALLDGEVVGTGCFYDRANYPRLMRETLGNYVSFFGLGSLSVLWRSRHMRSIMHPPKRSELYLSNFGVAAHVRSRGVGSRLIRHKLEEARRAGYGLFGLDVMVNNPRGQALYARLGLELKEEKVFSDSHAGLSAARKMELVL